MRVPVSTKPTVLGAIAGAALTMIVGFNQGGWMTGGTAERLADQRASAAVADALVPFCVDLSKADPQGTAKLAELAALASSYQRTDFVKNAGWATMPSATEPNGELAAACAKVLS
jgi:hypothetical protein